MTKELEAFNRISKAMDYADDMVTPYYEVGDFEIVENGLKRLEAIDNANPSEALKCSLKLYKMVESAGNSNGFSLNEAWKYHITIKQALLKAQEPKQYLKWEDLEFKEERQTIKVRMGNTIYNLFFYKYWHNNYKRCHLCNEEETLIYDIQEQLFNDLHLERVEE